MHWPVEPVEVHVALGEVEVATTRMVGEAPVMVKAVACVAGETVEVASTEDGVAALGDAEAEVACVAEGGESTTSGVGTIGH
ncbi:hypothetical protein E2562_032348 [Oryza meyeriana var. granulata]|uniref:Uncharacterized protein n=1 Tax=Oryza meyeriana var. granulata TaxID=110450 RepID=A0A6G1CAC4_9ORYZ|nr:hypothetical protein E2562_032348 [Oryza meyeriana var. granulata]